MSKNITLTLLSQRDGADYAVYINTAQEFDGCDSGASPDEALSWGKINQEAKYVKVLHKTSHLLPLITFEQDSHR